MRVLFGCSLFLTLISSPDAHACTDVVDTFDDGVGGVPDGWWWRPSTGEPSPVEAAGMLTLDTAGRANRINTDATFDPTGGLSITADIEAYTAGASDYLWLILTDATNYARVRIEGGVTVLVSSSNQSQGLGTFSPPDFTPADFSAPVTVTFDITDSGWRLRTSHGYDESGVWPTTGFTPSTDFNGEPWTRVVFNGEGTPNTMSFNALAVDGASCSSPPPTGTPDGVPLPLWAVLALGGGLAGVGTMLSGQHDSA